MIVHIGGQVEAPWVDRIFVNDIISDLAMQLAEDDPEADRRAVELLGNTIYDSVVRRDFRLAASMTPMAEAVIEEVRAQRRPISIPALPCTETSRSSTR